MAITKSHCGNNIEEHGIAGGEGIAQDPITAQIIAWALFVDAFMTADKSLRAYAAQPCPKGSKDSKGCPVKNPANPAPVYDNFNFSLRFDPGAPAVPAVPAVPKVAAVPAVPARRGRPARPARPAQPAKPAIPAIPARPAAYICTISARGIVTFDCENVDA
jgi:hypothetical protein